MSPGLNNGRATTPQNQPTPVMRSAPSFSTTARTDIGQYNDVGRDQKNTYFYPPAESSRHVAVGFTFTTIMGNQKNVRVEQSDREGYLSSFMCNLNSGRIIIF